ncbi:hypothetical protein [Pedobacter heparinus]|uniref:hypothetical protein n=1 Tax=Pedobacter heparinus TaxID=984 RepID=UPI0029308FFF|nr:hypothetical protein [Pedobacter heparinus]
MYNRSLNIKSDNKKVIDFNIVQAEQKARERELSRSSAAQNDVARNMKNKKLALETIAEITGLSIAEIEAL